MSLIVPGTRQINQLCNRRILKVASDKQIAKRIAAAIISNGGSEVERAQLQARLDIWFDEARADIQDIINDLGCTDACVAEVLVHVVGAMRVRVEQLTQELLG